MAEKKTAQATTQGKRRDGPAKAGKRKPPAARGPHVTTPESRKRGRWLDFLRGTPQPQHPREELTKLPSGGWERKPLPPQPRATRAEFFGPNHLPHRDTNVLIHNDAKVPPTEAARVRHFFETWRLRSNETKAEPSA